MNVFDEDQCRLGEGPLWHPTRNELFWFDILEKRLFSRKGNRRREWQFDANFSAAGWVDKNTLLIASEAALWRFDILTGNTVQICQLDGDNPLTRSNDGRADPWGGFWIGTMGKKAEPAAGAIYRYYRGMVRKLVDGITVSNAICFAPNQSCAYYTDTISQKIMRQALDADDGWPVGAPQVLVDLTARRLNPDGAVTDADGNLWVAVWGSSCVICFAPDGRELNRIDLPVRQPTCPAFGGPELRDLYITSARVGLPNAPLDGATFLFTNIAQGRPEPRVIL
ncbi:MAG: SMP-30/gluconolactonase/LRE family protein [Sulfitobacter sp.]